MIKIVVDNFNVVVVWILIFSVFMFKLFDLIIDISIIIGINDNVFVLVLIGLFEIDEI